MSGFQRQVGDFFRRIGQHLRRGSEVAGQWIDEQAAITQRLRAIRRLRTEQQSVLQTIGSKVYALHRRGKVRNKDVLAECQRIDEIVAHIARIRSEIEDIKRQSSRPEIQLMEVEDEDLLVEPEEAEGSGAEVTTEAAPEAAEGAAPAGVETTVEASQEEHSSETARELSVDLSEDEEVEEGEDKPQ